MHSPERNFQQEAAYKRDAELVKQTLSGDSHAFASLMSFYKTRISRLGMSFFRNESDTEDFVQDVFLKVFTKLSQFRGDSLFSTWITRIAYNTAVNSVKRKNDYLSIADETLLPDNSNSPEENQIAKITKEAIRTALKELPEKYAICLDLYFFYDSSYIQISEITEYPVNTIKSHIFRAKKILRDKLIEQQIIEN